MEQKSYNTLPFKHISQATDEINEGLSNVNTKLSRADLLDTMVNGVGQKSSYYRSIINN